MNTMPYNVLVANLSKWSEKIRTKNGIIFLLIKEEKGRLSELRQVFLMKSSAKRRLF